MRTNILYIFLIFVFALSSLSATSNVIKLDQLSPDEVPPNVRNAFNRIYIDQDPEAWTLEVVKPKGQKRSKRYTASFTRNGLSHSVRFDEIGTPIGEFYTLNRKIKGQMADKLTYEYPGYDVQSVESVWVYRENISAFKVSLKRKSKVEVIFIDEAGETLFDQMLQVEFGF